MLDWPHMTNKERLDAFHTLEKDWDSYGSEPVDLKCIERARKFLNEAFVVPLNDGGVAIEWDEIEGVYLNVEFHPGKKIMIEWVNDPEEE